MSKGKFAEKQSQDWLDMACARNKHMAYHRYPDARSARGALAAQPADYLVALHSPDRRRATHLEVKETAQPKRLPKAKISQYGKLLMFHLAGFETYVLVFRSAQGDWTYFDRKDLFDHDETPTSFIFRTDRSFPSAAAALERIYA